MKLLFLILNIVMSTTVLGAEQFDCIIEPYMTVKVGSPVLGVVDEVPIERGDLVKKGQLVTQLDSKIEKASYKLGEIRTRHLRQRLGRLLKLKENSLAAEESVDDATAELRISEMELQQRKLILEQKSIKSPVSGVVVQRLLAPGEYAYEQTPLMVIAQLDPLNVEILVPIDYHNKIKVGDKVKVMPEQPIGGSYTAEVEIIDRVMDVASSTFGVRLSLPNPDYKIPAGVKCMMEFK